jgi:hypothetical protein
VGVLFNDMTNEEMILCKRIPDLHNWLCGLYVLFVIMTIIIRIISRSNLSVKLRLRNTERERQMCFI